VRKSGPRALAQGSWLHEHRSRAVVEVFRGGKSQDDEWYDMEELHDIPWAYVVHTRILRDQARLLQEYVWSQPAEVAVDLYAHAAKVDGLADQYLDGKGARRFREARDRVEWDVLQQTLTHGDPTIENVMLREQDLVLIDPLPATPAVPDLLCVDVGKMMQSAVGWECVRYGRPFDHGIDDLARCLTLAEHEWDAASYWCGVHLLRTLPYVSTDIHREVIQLALTSLSGL
jgi:hypothetical protein